MSLRDEETATFQHDGKMTFLFLSYDSFCCAFFFCSDLMTPTASLHAQHLNIHITAVKRNIIFADFLEIWLTFVLGLKGNMASDSTLDK